MGHSGRREEHKDGTFMVCMETSEQPRDSCTRETGSWRRLPREAGRMDWGEP